MAGSCKRRKCRSISCARRQVQLASRYIVWSIPSTCNTHVTVPIFQYFPCKFTTVGFFVQVDKLTDGRCEVDSVRALDSETKRLRLFPMTFQGLCWGARCNSGGWKSTRSHVSSSGVGRKIDAGKHGTIAFWYCKLTRYDRVLQHHRYNMYKYDSMQYEMREGIFSPRAVLRDMRGCRAACIQSSAEDFSVRPAKSISQPVEYHAVFCSPVSD